MEFHDIDPKDFSNKPTPRPRGSRRAVPAIPVTPGIPLPLTVVPSTQERLRAPRRTDWEKMHDILGVLSKDLGGLGNFLSIFSPTAQRMFTLHTDICFARPALSSWALVLVAKEARKQIGDLTNNDPTDPTDTTQMRASTNGRAKNAVVADWEKLTEIF
ncbi:hypothetical protein GGX14DRAFT_384000 [Mycena pura]|uniref:Uncharacterized protein n=1 Tax=Mycena pura TaxID=153505 RepID=A0AAD7E5E9_9AGAR|nr:hypothetical protein GGX14DRAFT_384000 [Mycena pura]